MKIVQKVVFLSALLMSVVYFAYTLSFSTQWALGEIFGEFFVNAQLVNKTIFKLGLWTLILMAGNIIMNSHSNRRFYLLNYAFAVASAGLMVNAAIKTLSLLPPLRESYLQINELYLNIITSINYSTRGTQIFELGMILSYVMFVFAASVFSMAIYKLIAQLNRAKIKKMKAKEIVHG